MIGQVYAKFFRTLEDAMNFSQEIVASALVHGAPTAPHVEIWPVGNSFVATVRF